MMRRRAHYVLSSHWDREWYQPFQDFRYRLCNLLDRVIQGLHDGRLLGPFTTDGQAIILEDYLEVYPARRGEIERLARERKLAIGPWYVLPDEALVSGESLVRNLRMGRRVARELGATRSDAGFVCDLFGHVGQLPQILAGFGIRAGLVWRGVNRVGAHLVRWRGADGTEMRCYRFGIHGYCRYATEARLGAPPADPHRADPARTDEALERELAALIAREAAEVPDGPLLLFDGGDHQGWDEQAYGVLRRRMAEPADGIEVVHSSLDDYLAELQQHPPGAELLLEGELREPALHSSDVDLQWLIPGVLSSRVPLKQANARCQTLLCHWAEPASALAATLLGRAYPEGFLNVAWRWLLQNHPHDSICGCSIDRVHQDMVYRFSQCEQIGERLTTQALTAMAAHVEGDPKGDELRVVVFNPLPEPLEETIELTLPVPTQWPCQPSHLGVVRELMFHVYDEQRTQLPVQKLSQRWNRSRFRMFDSRFPQAYPVHEVRVSLPVSIPPMGYTTLQVRRGDPAVHARPKLGRSLVTGARSMENEFLAVAIESDGTLSMTDKRTGETYARLLTYEDTADTGDGWYYGPVVGDGSHYSAPGCASVALLADGPHLTTFRIRTTMKLPAAFEFGDEWRRSERQQDLVIDSYVSLRPGVPRVEVEVAIDNTVEDHRLRVLLPSGAANATTYFADSVYDAVERPIALREDNHLYREPEVETKPQQAWTAVIDGNRGLAVISEGLYESAVRDQPERPIALTLYRSTRRTVLTDGEPDGQLRQPLRFRFWIQPIAGELNPAGLCRLGQRLACGVRPSFLHAKDVALHRQGEARLPRRAAFLRISGGVVLSALEQREGRAELRLFNPSAREASALIEWPADVPEAGVPRQCQPVDFEGRPQGEAIPVTARRCEVPVGRRKIVTLRLE